MQTATPCPKSAAPATPIHSRNSQSNSSLLSLSRTDKCKGVSVGMISRLFPMNSILCGHGTRRFSQLAFPATAVALSLPAMAHPGHDLPAHGIGHALTSPDHALVLLGFGLGLWALGYALRSTRAARALRWAGTAAVLCGVALRFT